MILAQLSHKAFGGIAFAIIFVRAIAVRTRFGHERNDSPLVRMDDRGAHHLMRIGYRPIAVDAASTGSAVHRLGRKIPCAIQSQETMAIKPCHRFQRLATLEVPQDALERWAEPCGRAWIKDFAPARVARDPRTTVDGVQMPCSPFLGKGQKRGRFEGNPGKGRHERIGSGHLGLANTVIW